MKFDSNNSTKIENIARRYTKACEYASEQLALNDLRELPDELEFDESDIDSVWEDMVKWQMAMTPFTMALKYIGQAEDYAKKHYTDIDILLSVAGYPKLYS